MNKRYTESTTMVLIKDKVTGQFLNACGIAKLLNELEDRLASGRGREDYISSIKSKHKKRKKRIKKLENRIFILEKMVIKQDNGEKDD